MAAKRSLPLSVRMSVPRFRRREGQARGRLRLPRAAICFSGFAGGSPVGRRLRLRWLPDGPIVGDGPHRLFGSSEGIGEAPEKGGEREMFYGIREIKQLFGKSLQSNGCGRHSFIEKREEEEEGDWL